MVDRITLTVKMIKHYFIPTSKVMYIPFVISLINPDKTKEDLIKSGSMFHMKNSWKRLGYKIILEVSKPVFNTDLICKRFLPLLLCVPGGIFILFICGKLVGASVFYMTRLYLFLLNSLY